MDYQQGYSLLEILLSLFIITTLSLGLLTEQIFLKRKINTIQSQWRISLQQDNASELTYANAMLS